MDRWMLLESVLGYDSVGDGEGGNLVCAGGCPV